MSSCTCCRAIPRCAPTRAGRGCRRGCARDSGEATGTPIRSSTRPWKTSCTWRLAIARRETRAPIPTTISRRCSSTGSGGSRTRTERRIERASGRVDVFGARVRNGGDRGAGGLWRDLDRAAGDGVVGHDHAGAVVGDEHGAEDLDVDHAAALPGGLDAVADAEVVEQDDHHAGGEVRERSLQREPDGEAGGGDDADERGG